MGQSNFHRKPGRTQNKGRTTVKPPPVAIDTSDDETSDQCPEPTGFFADAEQCDKYYACNDGAISERLCPDGMVFNDYSIDQEKCDLPYNIDCSKRQKLRKYNKICHNSAFQTPSTFPILFYIGTVPTYLHQFF